MAGYAGTGGEVGAGVAVGVAVGVGSGVEVGTGVTVGPELSVDEHTASMIAKALTKTTTANFLITLPSNMLINNIYIFMKTILYHHYLNTLLPVLISTYSFALVR